MQTTSATSTGHTDLLSGILKVQVRNEEKITEQDRWKIYSSVPPCAKNRLPLNNYLELTL